MRVLSTVINLGEGLQPETKQGRHADIVAPFKSQPPVYTTFRRPEMVHILEQVTLKAGQKLPPQYCSH